MFASYLNATEYTTLLTLLPDKQVRNIIVTNNSSSCSVLQSDALVLISESISFSDLFKVLLLSGETVNFGVIILIK